MEKSISGYSKYTRKTKVWCNLCGFPSNLSVIEPMYVPKIPKIFHFFFLKANIKNILVASKVLPFVLWWNEYTVFFSKTLTVVKKDKRTGLRRRLLCWSNRYSDSVQNKLYLNQFCFLKHNLDVQLSELYSELWLLNHLPYGSRKTSNCPRIPTLRNFVHCCIMFTTQLLGIVLFFTFSVLSLERSVLGSLKRLLYFIWIIFLIYLKGSCVLHTLKNCFAIFWAWQRTHTYIGLTNPF